MAIMESVGQVGLMVALILGIFRFEAHSFSRETLRLYNEGKKRAKFSPPSWLFYIVWPIMYVLEVAAVFRYVVRQVPINFGTHTDAVVILFLVQALLCAWWHPVFFRHRKYRLAGAFVILILIAQLACLAIMGADDEWVSFGLMLILFMWCLFAAILNFYWIYIVNTYSDDFSQFDSDNENEYEEQISSSSTKKRGTLVKKC